METWGDLKGYLRGRVMPNLPIIVVLFAARDAWTRRRRQVEPVPIERGRKPWIS